MRKLIGRESEKQILLDAVNSKYSELIVLYGRRRIGKTFLIRQVYKDRIRFEFSGVYKGSLKSQLENFHLKLSDHVAGFNCPASWMEAFHQLQTLIKKIRSKKKKVLFIDEFPWLDTRKSGFLQAFDNFWNSYISRRDDWIVVVCGSAASYMIRNIVSSRGGLHNRMTRKINLGPFNLHEAEKLLRYNGIKLTRYDVLKIYMVMGGVPLYLEKILPGESVSRTIDRLCFTKDGFLRDEFRMVFRSLFEYPEKHEEIIRLLAAKRKGLTRNMILEKSGISSGGRMSGTLEELEESGFIFKYSPYRGTKKDALYQLRDEYAMFYIKFIEPVLPGSGTKWQQLEGSPSYRSWAGFSFEMVCLKHVVQIKDGLEIKGVNSRQGSWTERNNIRGAQIDLVIDRDDNIINLCEIKFYNTEFTINKSYAADLEYKKNLFLNETKTRKGIFITFISTYGLVKNKYYHQIVQNELTMEVLFRFL